MTFADPRVDLREGLSRTANNAALYATLATAQRGCEVSKQVGYSAESGYRLIRVDDRLNAISGNQFEIALVDDAQSSVAYYDKFTLCHVPGIENRHAVRHQVWRSADERHMLPLRDLSQKLLFGYIAQYYDILIAEDDISGGGKFYWHRQVSRAIERGFHVSVYDHTEQAFLPVSTQRALNEIMDQAWSADNLESLLALVSTLPLSNQ